MNTKLKHLLPALLLVFSLSFNFAKAQSRSSNPLSFDIGIDGGAPVGQNRPSNFAAGITPELEYGSKDLKLTLNTGVYEYFSRQETVIFPGDSGFGGIYHFKTVNETLVPVKVGFKGYFSGGWYLGVETGLIAAVNNGGGNAFDLAGKLGYTFNSWDLGVRWEEFIKHGSGGTAFLRLAYRFQ